MYHEVDRKGSLFTQVPPSLLIARWPVVPRYGAASEHGSGNLNAVHLHLFTLLVVRRGITEVVSLNSSQFRNLGKCRLLSAITLLDTSNLYGIELWESVRACHQVWGKTYVSNLTFQKTISDVGVPISVEL